MRLKKNILRKEWQGRIFIMPPDAGEDQPPLVLNETADRLLHMLTAETSRDAMLAALLEEYAVGEAELAADLDDFLARLRAFGLLDE